MAKPEIQSTEYDFCKSLVNNTEIDNVRASDNLYTFIKVKSGLPAVQNRHNYLCPRLCFVLCFYLMNCFIKIILLLVALWARYHMKMKCAFICYVKWSSRFSEMAYCFSTKFFVFVGERFLASSCIVWPHIGTLPRPGNEVLFVVAGICFYIDRITEIRQYFKLLSWKFRLDQLWNSDHNSHHEITVVWSTECCITPPSRARWLDVSVLSPVHTGDKSLIWHCWLCRFGHIHTGDKRTSTFGRQKLPIFDKVDWVEHVQLWRQSRKSTLLPMCTGLK